MTTVMRKAYAEIDEILKYLPVSYIEKLPKNVLEIFEKLKIEEHKVKIDFTRPLEEQRLLRETVVLLAVLQYNFWCESDEEKQKMMEKFKENEKKHKEMYDISNIGNREKKTFDAENSIMGNQSKKNLPVKVEKESWFSKIIMKIKNVFKK